MVAASETSSTQRNIPAYPELVPNCIDGKSSIGRGERLPIFDPSTGERIAELAEADEGTVSAAVDNARATFDSRVWSKVPVAERQAVLASRGITGQALLTGFQKLLRPAVIQVLVNAFLAAQC